MKILLDIKDNKALHLLEVLRSLPYVKATQISNEKAEVIEKVKVAIEELNQIKNGKIKGIPAKDLLNEL
jgi:DNA-binding protein H-NS